MRTLQEAIDLWSINQDPNEWIYLYDIDDSVINNIPENVRGLEITNCRNLVSVKNLSSIDTLTIINTNIGSIELPHTLRNLILRSSNIGTINLPPHLRILRISDSDGTYFTKLPIDLVELTLMGMNMDKLPELPQGLVVLDIEGCKIKNMPRINDNLLYLDLSKSSIDRLDELPYFLEELHISHTIINWLPELPNTLEILNCSMSMLNEIPKLPCGFKELYCACMPFLKKIPDLPHGTTILSAYMNEHLSSLPHLPSTLEELYINNTGVVLLENLPTSIRTIEMYECPNLLVRGISNESVSDYNARCKEYLMDRAISMCKMIKEELLHLTWGPDYIMNYVNKYGQAALALL